MRRVLRELLRRRLEAAVTKVQYAWREQMRWRTFLAEDVATVYEQESNADSHRSPASPVPICMLVEPLNTVGTILSTFALACASRPRL